MNWLELTSLLPLLLVASISVILLLLIAFVRDHKLTCWVTCVGFAMAAYLAFADMGNTAQQVTPLLIVDDFSRLLVGVVLLVSLACGWMSYAYLETADEIREEYYILLSLAALGACVLIASNHFASMFIGLELMSVSLFAMVGYMAHSKQQANMTLEAGVKYMVLSGVSSSFLLFGVALIYAYAGNLSIDLEVAAGGPHLQSGYLVVGSALLLVGVAFKMSWIPFHMWTPDVYQGAPAPVTGFLAGAVKVAVFAFAMRWLIMAQGDYLSLLLLGLTVMALLSMVMGNLLALRQNNLKRLLGYSSIAHMGYIIVTLAATATHGATALSTALEGAAIYLITYASMTMLAFAVISQLAAQDRGFETGTLAQYTGLLFQQPLLASALILAMLALAGMPLTAGFIGKYYLVLVAVDSQLWLLLSMLVLGSALGLYYYLRVILVLCKTPIDDHPIDNQIMVFGMGDKLLLLLLMLMTLWLGLYPTPVIEWVQLAIA
jgi:NADH-quinone oxidoreductase subunit N